VTFGKKTKRILNNHKNWLRTEKNRTD